MEKRPLPVGLLLFPSQREHSTFCSCSLYFGSCFSLQLAANAALILASSLFLAVAALVFMKGKEIQLRHSILDLRRVVAKVHFHRSKSGGNCTEETYQREYEPVYLVSVNNHETTDVAGNRNSLWSLLKSNSERIEGFSVSSLFKHQVH